MTDSLIKSKDTCPDCASDLKNGTANEGGINKAIKHCEVCFWWG